MTFETLLPILTRLTLGTFAAFFAIIVWARNRDMAWVLVVGAILLTYGEIVLSILDLFGLVSLADLSIGDIPVVKMVLAGMPLLLFSVAFIVIIRRR